MEEQNRKPHFHVTAGVIWRDERVLIAKRPQGTHLEGFWEFPGGKQEEGESLAECLEREIKEELGLKVIADKPILTISHEYDSKMITLHVFNCKRLAGEQEDLHCKEIRWVDPMDLTKYHFPPPDQKVIEFLSRSKNRPGGED